MAIGPTGPRYREIHTNSVAAGFPSLATLITALTGANNDLTYTSVGRGAAANLVTVRYVDPAANDAALGVSVTGSAITVNLATDNTGAITSTGSQVRTAVLASSLAAALVGCALAPSNSGAGVVTALSVTPLAGGANYVIGAGS